MFHFLMGKSFSSLSVQFMADEQWTRVAPSSTLLSSKTGDTRVLCSSYGHITTIQYLLDAPGSLYILQHITVGEFR